MVGGGGAGVRAGGGGGLWLFPFAGALEGSWEGMRGIPRHRGQFLPSCQCPWAHTAPQPSWHRKGSGPLWLHRPRKEPSGWMRHIGQRRPKVSGCMRRCSSSRAWHHVCKRCPQYAQRCVSTWLILDVQMQHLGREGAPSQSMSEPPEVSGGVLGAA